MEVKHQTLIRMNNFKKNPMETEYNTAKLAHRENKYDDKKSIQMQKSTYEPNETHKWKTAIQILVITVNVNGKIKYFQTG